MMFEKRREKKMRLFSALIMAMLVISVTSSAFAVDVTYVMPRIGGAQRMHDVAPMIMPEITFDGSDISVLNMGGNAWTTLTGANRPIMMPLADGDEFDPTTVWYTPLNDKAYNFQYGWNNGGFNPALLPQDGKVWIEVLSQSQGLSTYDRGDDYAPIFGTNGSSNRWMWTESMAHNTYAVEPGIGEWSATYRVYIGDATTGELMNDYGSQDVTFTWTSVPEPTTMGLMLTGVVCLIRKRRKQ